MSYKVKNEFIDGITGEKRTTGEIIEVDENRVDALKGFIEPVKAKREIETEMFEGGERMILEKPKNKVKR